MGEEIDPHLAGGIDDAHPPLARFSDARGVQLYRGPIAQGDVAGDLVDERAVGHAPLGLHRQGLGGVQGDGQVDVVDH